MAMTSGRMLKFMTYEYEYLITIVFTNPKYKVCNWQEFKDIDVA